MCTGLEIPLLMTAIGGVASAAGGAINQNAQDANATAEQVARNKVLTDTMGLNKPIAADARGAFNGDLAGVQPTAFAGSQSADTAGRQSLITSNLPTFTPANMPGSADGSTLVKSAIADAVNKSLANAQTKATAQAQLGGYGDVFLNQGLADKDASNRINTDINFTNGNNALIQPVQEIEANGSYTPISPIGSILQGVGSAVGTAAGAGKFGKAA